ncbi:hypothetical protein ILUMI_12501 [Ignelater luminosus]|uniref:Peptidase S1 domain-containing protein n=1 Tax=Ignelater luminosus TaxID=2038154 RepID=A0A8K0GC90_IGNLU|nr:hypothetical protein ILUMI_12501 [Ignelater luminosus]
MHAQFVTVSFSFVFYLVTLLTEVRSIQNGKGFFGLPMCGTPRAEYTTEVGDSITSTAAIDEFPWTAALIYKFERCEIKEAILCTGALISSNCVLTAAQCIRSPKKTKLDRVRLGEYNITKRQECIVEEYGEECIDFIDREISETIVHENYNEDTKDNDIAILILSSKSGGLQFSDFIRPICLAATNMPENSPALRQQQTVFISGWGARSFNESQSEIKKKVVSELITNEECRRAFTSRSITKNHICTKDLRSNKAFTSFGDAGAPVMSKCNPRVWCLIGLFSWTANADSKPRVHTRISEYADWIRVNANLPKGI